MAVEIGLAAVRPRAAARAFWAIFAPLPTPAVQPATLAASNLTPASVADPFAKRIGAGEAVAQAAVETTLDLVLFGTWADGEGRGTAIIQHAGGAQKKFAVGDIICCGARLAEVFADRVVIVRAGARETLRLPNKAPAQGGALAPAVVGAQISISPSSVVLAPVIDQDGLLTLMMAPGSDPAAFAALGLQPGDRLIAINGSPVPSSAGEAAALLETFAGSPTISATIERAGTRLSLDIPTSALGGAPN